MSIEVSAGDGGIVRHPVIWHEVEHGEAVFIVLKGNAVGLASEEYILGQAAQIYSGDLAEPEAWDGLSIKTDTMQDFTPCVLEFRRKPDGQPEVIFRDPKGFTHHRMTL